MSFRTTRRETLRAVAAGTLATGALGTSSAAVTGDEQRERWTFDILSDANAASPTVAYDTVYMGSFANFLFAVDPADGTLRWEFELGVDTPGTFGRLFSAPVAADGTLYVGSVDHTLYALDAITGSELWRFEAGTSIGSTPAVADGVVYVGDRNGVLYAVDAEEGEELWQYDTGGGWVDSGPVAADGAVFFGTFDQDQDGDPIGIYALEADGEERWSREVDSILANPTVADGTVYAAGTGIVDGEAHSAVALDTDDGTLQWSHELGAETWSTPTVADGVVYVGSEDSTFYALAADDGELQWQASLDTWVNSGPTVAEDVVYVGTRTEGVYAFDVDDGNERWSLDTGGRVASSPVVVEGALYVGSDSEELYAIETDVTGSSRGSRVELGGQGHHHSFAGEGPDTVELTGTVVDDDGTPVPDATVAVRLDGPGGRVPVDDDGEYTTRLTAGRTYELFVSATNHESTTTTVTAQADDGLVADFTLDREEEDTDESDADENDTEGDEEDTETDDSADGTDEADTDGDTADGDDADGVPTDDDGPGFGAGGALAGLGGAGYLLKRRLSPTEGTEDEP